MIIPLFIKLDSNMYYEEIYANPLLVSFPLFGYLITLNNEYIYIIICVL